MSLLFIWNHHKQVKEHHKQVKEQSNHYGSHFLFNSSIPSILIISNFESNSLFLKPFLLLYCRETKRRKKNNEKYHKLEGNNSFMIHYETRRKCLTIIPLVAPRYVIPNVYRCQTWVSSSKNTSTLTNPVISMISHGDKGM